MSVFVCVRVCARACVCVRACFVFEMLELVDSSVEAPHLVHLADLALRV